MIAVATLRSRNGGLLCIQYSDGHTHVGREGIVHTEFILLLGEERSGRSASVN